jgi:hypothetical protein
MADIYSFRPAAMSYFYAYPGCTRFWRRFSVAMARNALALDFIFVFD